MSRIVIQRDSFIASIPVDPRTPGTWTGAGRADVVKSLFSLATEKGYAVNVAGQHWPHLPVSTASLRMASNKMSRGFRRMPGVSRKVR